MGGREGKSWPSCGLRVTEERLAEGGFLWHMPWGQARRAPQWLT